MNILFDICGNSHTLRLVYIIKTFITILFTVTPIIIIAVTIKNLVQVTTSGKEDDMKKTVSLSVRRIIAALIIFFIPAIVNYTITALADDSYESLSCYESVTATKIKELEAKEREEAKTGIKDKQDEVDKANEKSAKEREEQAKSGEKLKKDRPDVNNNGNGSGDSGGDNSGGSGDTGNIGDNNGGSSGEILNSGTTGTYFAPLQNVQYSVSGASTTPGCSNSSGVFHDASTSVGNKIYAPYDGVVEYIQSTCGNVLYSYGNQARVKDPTTGTYIIFAHLSRFEGVTAKYTQTCNPPCSYTTCSSGISKTTIGTRNVKKGEVIGYTGSTGNSLSPHLHVEIHEGGSSTCVTDPYKAFGMR